MAEERRKGPPERRRSRAASAPQSRGEATTSSTGAPDVEENEKARAQNPNDTGAFDADQLAESIRARQQEDRGEVF